MKTYVRIEWNIPNLLSLLRLLLVPAFVVLFFGNETQFYWSFVVLALSGLSDAADGFIARKFNQITDFGKLLDPIADKLTQVTVVICMAIKYNQLLPLAVLCLIKESFQSIGGFLLLAILNSVGLIPASVSGIIKSTSKFLMVTALAAIGLGTSITDFKKAGLKPMFYGITIDTLVTLTALGVIWGMGLM